MKSIQHYTAVQMVRETFCVPIWRALLSINGKDTERYVRFVSFCKQKEVGEEPVFVLACTYLHEDSRKMGEM